MPHLLKSFLHLGLLLLLTQTVSAQSYRASLRAGQKALAEADYYSALHYFSQILDHKDANSRLWYDYARSAQAMNAFKIAEEYYQKVIEKDGYNAFPAANYQLGLIHKTLGQYEAASVSFQRFLQQKTVPDSLKSKAQRQLRDAEWAKSVQATDSLQIERIGKRLNTPYSEFGAFPWKDTLYYSSYRYPLEGDKHKPERKISKLLFARGTGRGRLVGRNFNLDTLNTAHASISSNGNRLYYTQCRYVNGTRIRCELVYRDRVRRGRWSTKVQGLPPTINLPGFTQTQPSVGFDSIQQKEVLYFSSDRPGGKGGLDIWYLYPPQAKEDWPEPQALSAINTAEDELTPFWHTDSQTLYFSSDGYTNFGGYDIFRTSLSTNQKWAAPLNLGLPINSSYNDLYFAPNSNGSQTYLSSNRPGSAYLDKDFQACCFDLYLVTAKPSEEVPGKPVVDLPEEPTEPEPQPRPEPREPETLEEFLPLALYFDNDEPDRRTRRTTTKKSYSETYTSYWDRQDVYRQNYPSPDKVSTFFAEDVKANFDKLNRFSAMLLRQLRKGEEIEIFLQGFTSPRAEGDYNLRLGKRRVSAVRNHFDEYSKGAFAKYLENEQLIITEISFGETQAAADVSDDLLDEAASIYSPSAARERRVEIVEVQRE